MFLTNSSISPNVGNTFRSMQSGFQTSLSSKLPYLPNVVLPYFGQRFRIHANGKIFRLNLGNAFKSTQLSFQLKSTNPIRAISISNRLLNVGNSFKSKSQICFQIQCAVLYSASKLNPFSLQVQSQLGLQMQSQLSHRQIIPQWNFSLKSSQPSKSALATAELSNRGISPLNSSQPSNSTTLSADFTNLRSILQFLR